MHMYLSDKQYTLTYMYVCNAYNENVTSISLRTTFTMCDLEMY